MNLACSVTSRALAYQGVNTRGRDDWKQRKKTGKVLAVYNPISPHIEFREQPPVAAGTRVDILHNVAEHVRG